MVSEETGPEDGSEPRSGAETGIDPAESDRMEPRWWESADDHRFAPEILPLAVRWDILKFIGEEIRSAEGVAEKFGIDRKD
jgi:hypothetical protein